MRARQYRDPEFVTAQRRNDGAGKQLREPQCFVSRNLIVERMGAALVMKNPAKVSPTIDANPMSIISVARSMAHSKSTQPHRNYAGLSIECRVEISIFTNLESRS